EPNLKTRIQHGNLESVLLLGRISFELFRSEQSFQSHNFHLWTLIAHSGIIYNWRKTRVLQAVPIYGFLTDSVHWEFIRIDSNATIWISK
ncbi:hypothetical protein HDU91_004042, partial [Kappamyces sp. JEL0680]